MDSIFSSTDNRIAFGFSKTASPANVTTDWCHYYFTYATPFPDYPKLGDSRYFIIVGVNVFANNSTGGFVGSDIVAISKPANGAITTCPAASSFKKGKKANIKDTGNNQVFTPVPSNQIDTINTGYVVAMNGNLPANKLWFFNVTRHPVNGSPVFGNARGVTVSGYNEPPSARQPTFTQVLDTLDGRNTQAIQARNPTRSGTVYSFWTQHTIANASVSGVRWYEINPAPATPVVLRSGNIVASNTFLFNAAISPDRKVHGSATAFGRNFVIQYNAASRVNSISPRIVAASSVNGGALSLLDRQERRQRLSRFHLSERRQPLSLGRLRRGDAGSGADDNGARRGLGHQPVFRPHQPARRRRQLAYPDLRLAALNQDAEAGSLGRLRYPGKARSGLYSFAAASYIHPCRGDPAMAINGRRNKPFGPGGSTRRLHPSPSASRQRDRDEGFRRGRNRIDEGVKGGLLLGMVPPLSGHSIVANDNYAPVAQAA